MKKRHYTKLVQVGHYVAEVDIHLVDSDLGWAPYLSLADAQKLDDVRVALQSGDIKAASKLARIYTLSPVAV